MNLYMQTMRYIRIEKNIMLMYQHTLGIKGVEFVRYSLIITVVKIFFDVDIYDLKRNQHISIRNI